MESYLALGDAPADNRALLDLVSDYLFCGQHQTAIDLLNAANPEDIDGSIPLLYYTLGYLLRRAGQKDEGDHAWQRAAAASQDTAFRIGWKR